MKISFFEAPAWLFTKGALVFILGPLNHQPAYLVVAMVIDVIFGVQVAIKTNTFKWKILLKKFFVKALTYACWIVMFHGLDMVMGLPNTARWSLIVILFGLEIASAVKNTSKLGYGALADAISVLYLTLTKAKGGTRDAESTETPQQRSTDDSQSGDSNGI